MLGVEAAVLLIPAFVSAINNGEDYQAFLLTSAVLALICFLTARKRPKDSTIYGKEGLVIVAVAWVLWSLFGALPFTLSGSIPNYIDAFFETVSGFTTTGASVLTNVEKMSQGLLFWRSFTHWIGGMGVLVFVMAIIPNISDRSIHIIRAEMPGPIVGKLVPKLKVGGQRS